MLQYPSVGFTEVAWRWTFRFTALGLFVFTLVEYLDTLPVNAGDLTLLRTGRSSSVAQAVTHMLSGSGPRLITVLVLVVVTLMVCWVALASAGRWETVRLLQARLGHAETGTNGRFDSLLVLNALRALLLAAMFLSLAGALILVNSPGVRVGPPALFRLTFLVVAVSFVWAARSQLDRLLILAALFAVADGKYAIAAFHSAVTLYGERRWRLFTASVWFGMARLTAFVVAGSLATSVLALANLIPPAVTMLGVLAVALLYFVVADFLGVGKLAAHLVLVLWPEIRATLGGENTNSLTVASTLYNPSSGSGVDPDELILSDVPS